MSLHDDGLTRAYRFAQSCALTEHSRGRGDEERQWLDVLALLDLARHPEDEQEDALDGGCGPAEIRRCPPAPETGRMYWESYCAICTTHEGLYGDAEEPRLVALRDDHNRAHRHTPLAQLQAQAPAPVGDSPQVRENGVSDGEREALIALNLASERFLAPDGHYSTGYRTNKEAADIVIAAGYRKAPVVNVEDMAKEILEAWCWDGDGEQPAPEVRAATAIKAHLLDGESTRLDSESTSG